MEYDYKAKIDLIDWHSLYTKLNGTDAKVLMRFIIEANYKSGEVRFGLGELVSQIGSDKNSISKSIKKLIEQEVLIIVEKGIGTKPTNYKLSSVEKLNILFKEEKSNRKNIDWLNERDKLFYDIEILDTDLRLEIEECEECKSGEYTNNICMSHNLRKKELEENIEYKKYKVWLLDNPKPNHSVRTIKGKIVE